MDPTDQTGSFLRASGMFHGDLDAREGTRVFLEEMEAGLAGRPSSLRMIPTFIEAEGAIPPGEPVVALDAGGTNLRVALVEFDAAGQPHLSRFQKHRMPGLDGEISADEFFGVLAGRVRELSSRVGRIGFSFSYPADILPTRDGRIIGLCKEMRVAGIEGELVGARLIAALQAAGSGGGVRVVVLNDAVGALLAGRAAPGGSAFSAHAGYVLGTGLNCSYVEASGRIRKAHELAGGSRQVINVESGAYARAPRGVVDRALDAASTNPGAYVFEKSISGGYLGALCLQTLQVAAEAGLFSPGARECLRAWPRLATPELHPFLGGEPGEGLHAALGRRGTPADVGTASSLVDLLVERAAKLAAMSFAAVLLSSQGNGAPEGEVCITVDGSTFHRLRSFRERITGWVDHILGGSLRYRVVSVEHAALIGAAVGGLTN